MDLNHNIGDALEGWPHVVQCIETLLSTRRSTRVFRREYGSGVSGLIDAPMNDANLLSLYVAVAEAIEQWEPRFELTGVQVETLATGTIAMILIGNYLPNGHLGDPTVINSDTHTIRLQADRSENWSLAA